jgi:uncharacterized protein YabN with tetrapyrrole methylase and pyrophosphatase domain
MTFLHSPKYSPRYSMSETSDDEPRHVESSALLFAEALQRHAAALGFDWDDASGPLAKISEEHAELADALAAGASRDKLAAELGDLLFSCVNLARHLALDPAEALQLSCEKFRRRFDHIESSLKHGKQRLDQVGIDELERLWQEAKRLEG